MELFYDSPISAKLFPNSFANPLLDSTASTELLHESPVSINQNYECPPSANLPNNFATPTAGIKLAIIQALPPAMDCSQIIISVQLQQRVLEFLTQSRKNSDELLLEYKKLRSAISQEYPEAEVDRIVASYIDTDVQALIAASRQRKRTLDTRINAKIAALQARWGHQSTESFVQALVDFSAEAPMVGFEERTDCGPRAS
jgi:lambda repressor-like predicted transcriptional regulator